MNPEQIMHPVSEHSNRATSFTTPDTEPEQIALPELQPASRREARELDRLRAERGLAFESYLLHVWNGTESILDMDTNFENLYYASYDKIEHFIEDGIDALGWASLVKEVIQQHAIPPKLLIWDYPAYLGMVQNDYQFIEQGGQIHVFIA